MPRLHSVIHPTPSTHSLFFLFFHLYFTSSPLSFISQLAVFDSSHRFLLIIIMVWELEGRSYLNPALEYFEKGLTDINNAIAHVRLFGGGKEKKRP
jgi:hypothetical protein